MYLPAADEQIRIGVLRMVVQVPGSRSLKDRRRAIAGLRDRVYARHHASLAEVGMLEVHDRVVLAVALVANDTRVLQSRLDAIRAEAESRADLVLIDQQREIFPFSSQEMG